jgi:hypothetical protein
MIDQPSILRRLSEAVTAVRALEGAWGLWADSVRQEVENRLGVAYPVPLEISEPIVMADGGYCRALDVGVAVDRLQVALREVVSALAAVEGPQ